MMENELKPCPFCGSEPMQKQWQSPGTAEQAWTGITCSLDSCILNNISVPVGVWNTRPSPWTPIRTAEDLPKENEGSYMWEDSRGEGKRKIFTAPLSSSTRDYLLRNCIAWAELPEPYAPPVNDSDDAC